MTSRDIPKVSNVLSVYNNATADNMRVGLAWYLDAHNLCVSLAGNRGQFGHATRVRRIAGIIAALSPMNGWENNKRKAIKLINQNGHVEWGEDGSNGISLGTNVRKAQAIYFGADPDEILNGDKVTAFFRTILDPTGDIDPVIDRHAFDIAVGERTNDKRRGRLSNVGVYGEFADVYREAARIAGIGSAQIQAITWIAWREIHDVAKYG